MKPILILVCLIAIYMTSNIENGNQQVFQTLFSKAEAQTVSVEKPQFERGHTSKVGMPWQKMPCRNHSTGEAYESDILSPEEIKHHLLKAGANEEQAKVLVAIAKAESGHQLNCFGDEHLTNSKWTYSYGLFQIRGLNAETGTGSCRDVKSLENDVGRQAECAWEISGHGATFRPWTQYINGKYREFL